MTITVRRSGPADRAAVLALLDGARGDGRGADDLAEHGFVQSGFSAEALAAREPWVFLAEEDGALAGVAVTGGLTGLPAGPPALSAELAAERKPGGRPFGYGPVVVAPGFRGRGVLRLLLSAITAARGPEYTHGVLFVDRRNAKSLAVHRHLGMTELGDVDWAGHPYAVLTFAV
jgi:GNAT superfamily N-acetyltransferase